MFSTIGGFIGAHWLALLIAWPFASVVVGVVVGKAIARADQVEGTEPQTDRDLRIIKASWALPALPNPHTAVN